MTDNQIEDEIQAKGLTAPRVTPADIEANIASEHYFTADDGAWGAARHQNKPKHPQLSLLTFCVLVLRNGFTVTGESACASPENFDAEVGRKIARANAVNKVWPLMGYALRERLAAVPAYFRDRVRKERDELKVKFDALAVFAKSEKFLALPIAEQERMHQQAEAMQDYLNALNDRIAAF